MEKVKLTVKGLKADLDGGITRAQMATKYGLSPAQIKLALKQAGLEGYKTRKVAFELIEEEEQMTAKFPGGAEVSFTPGVTTSATHAPLSEFVDSAADNAASFLEEQAIHQTFVNEL